MNCKQRIIKKIYKVGAIHTSISDYLDEWIYFIYLYLNKINKNEDLFAFFALFMVLGVMGQRIIDRPHFGSRTTETRTVTRVELTDTATIFYVDARYRPRWWIKVESGEYISFSGGGEKLFLKRAEGISIDKEFYMPVSGQHSFKLIFPPVPSEVSHLDWYMDENEGIFDIAVTDQVEKRLLPGWY